MAQQELEKEEDEKKVKVIVSQHCKTNSNESIASQASAASASSVNSTAIDQLSSAEFRQWMKKSLKNVKKFETFDESSDVSECFVVLLHYVVREIENKKINKPDDFEDLLTMPKEQAAKFALHVILWHFLKDLNQETIDKIVEAHGQLMEPCLSAMQAFANANESIDSMGKLFSAFIGEDLKVQLIETGQIDNVVIGKCVMTREVLLDWVEHCMNENDSFAAFVRSPWKDKNEKEAQLSKCLYFVHNYVITWNDSNVLYPLAALAQASSNEESGDSNISKYCGDLEAHIVSAVQLLLTPLKLLDSQEMTILEILQYNATKFNGLKTVSLKELTSTLVKEPKYLKPLKKTGSLSPFKMIYKLVQATFPLKTCQSGAVSWLTAFATVYLAKETAQAQQKAQAKGKGKGKGKGKSDWDDQRDAKSQQTRKFLIDVLKTACV